MKNKPKLNQPDVEPSTTVEPNTSITFNNEIDNIPFGKTYSIKEYRKLIRTRPPYPTLEDVRKEWEDDGYTWEEDKDFITICKALDEEVVKEILIYKYSKTYVCYNAADYDNTSLSLTIKEHIRLTKTFIAKGWEVNK